MTNPATREYLTLTAFAFGMIGFGLGAITTTLSLEYYPYGWLPDAYVVDSPHLVLSYGPEIGWPVTILATGGLAIVLALLAGYKIDRDYADVDARLRYGIDDPTDKQ